MSNDSSATNISSRGIGLAGILTVIFVLAKLFGVISWPWLWVLAPTLISFALSIVILVVLLIIVAVIK